MKIASEGWTYDMAIDEDPFLNPLSCSLDGHDLDFNNFHSEGSSSYPYQQPHNNFHIPSEIPDPTPAKQLKHHVFPPTKNTSYSYPKIISFGKTSSSRSSPFSDYEEMTKNNFSSLASQGETFRYGQLYNSQGASCNKKSTGTHLHAREHLIAERKRRERLNQRIIALSAIIPGLKKMDKASILEDAIKYLRQLEEKVKALEEEVSKKTLESVDLVKKSRLPTDDGTTSSDENSYNQSNQQNLPEIEARVSGKFVLIRIHCRKREGCVSKIIDEIEKLNLIVLNSSVLPFGSCILDITIIAQMEVEINMKFEDFNKNLRRALLSVV